MLIKRLDNFIDLEKFQERWDQIAGDSIFSSYEWLKTWWKHYGAENTNYELSVLLLLNSNENSSCKSLDRDPCIELSSSELIGILPCYIDSSLTRGKILRLLGDGEVCSEHLSLLTSPKNLDQVAQQLASYLTNEFTSWDLLQLTAVGEKNTPLIRLIDSLSSQGCQQVEHAGPNCWSISLPENWENFLASQSKSHRKQLRRLEKRVHATESACWKLVESEADFDIAWAILIDLHQQRRISLGEPGCFASEKWAAFHQDIARQLLTKGQLRLSWLEIDGQPIAAEYHFAGERATYAYQGGLDPKRLDEEPGRLSMIVTIQNAIDEGHTSFDLLRGDEPYKPHWRATPEPTFDYQIIPQRSAAQLRYRAWNTTRRVGKLARQFANLLS